MNFDRAGWTVQTLGDFLDQQQKNNEDRVRGIYERDQATHKAQLDGINKRLEVITDLYNRSIENNLRAVGREEFERAINAGRERLEDTIGPINKALSDAGKPQWALLSGFMAVALGVLSGCWLLIGLQINVAITPQALAIEAVRAGNTGLQTALNSLETRVRAAEVATTQSGAQMVEIETQFCASDSVRNLMHAADMRITSMLWAKVNPGERLPTDNVFYPSICNRSNIMPSR